MPSSAAVEPLVAEQFVKSTAVSEAVDQIVAELKRSQASITAARPPQDSHRETMADYLKRQEAVKGKGAWYPYVGSGMGNGPLVELIDGSVKWDMINGIGVHMFGHSDPELVRAALLGAMGDTVMEGNLQFNRGTVDFGDLLIKEASRNSKLAHAFLINSGALANENALKICFQKNHPASRVIAFMDCFMGRTWTMAQIGDSAGARAGLPLNTLIDYMPFYDADRPEQSIEHAVWHLKQYIARYPKQHACFIFELVQGEGGFNVGTKAFFEPLMQLCRENGIAVWVDEIQTFGRTEEMFFFEQLGLGEYVDVVTIGKMSQICACLFTEAYNPKPGLMSATFSGSSVAYAVGLQVLERMRAGGYYGKDGRNAKLQQAFRRHAKALVDKHQEWFPPVPRIAGLPGVSHRHVDGVGGMMRLTPFGGDRAKIMKALNILFEEGVIAFACGHGPFHIRFLPPVGVFEEKHFGPVFEIVERALAKV